MSKEIDARVAAIGQRHLQAVRGYLDTRIRLEKLAHVCTADGKGGCKFCDARISK